MRCYFKREAESALGSGVVYVEFDGEWATHQAEIYHGRWFCSNIDSHPEIGPALMDQPLSVVALKPEHEISKEEFEEICKQAKKSCTQ